MKLFITSLLLLLALPLLSISTVSAQVDPFEKICQDDPGATVCQDKQNPTNPIAGEDGVVMRVVKLLAFVVGIASVIMIILGGLKYVTSGGDANAISSAKNTILYALIGLGVFAVSEVIIVFVISRL